MKREILTFTGPDRPGLVAAISGILADVGADIEDVSMTRLSGNFALMLLARGGDEKSLREKLDSTARQFGLHWHMEPAVDEAEHQEPNVFVSAVGPNRVGILATLARVLAQHGANIVEMTTRLIEKTTTPVYLVRIEAYLQERVEPLELDLQQAGREIGIEVRVEPITTEEL